MLYAKNRCELILAAPEISDVGFIKKLANDDEHKYPNGFRKFSSSEIEQYIRYGPGPLDTHVDYLIKVKDGNGEFKNVGRIGFYNIDKENSRAEIGIIIDKDRRKKGFAKFAIEEAILISRTKMALKTLYAFIDTSNFSSINLFENSGFTKMAMLAGWQRVSYQSFSDVYLFVKSF